ncbi:hypothetical protein [Lonepinella sp. BR2474]|uniref:hypothetical protein n=1 Tax=Lonepinella sp. BR2474 TaxID=3434548 RepID=UPI003F6DE0DB
MKVDFKTYLYITPESKYLAKLVINGEFYCKTAVFDEKRHAIDAINKEIKRYNFEHKTRIPLMTTSHRVVLLALGVNDEKGKAKQKATAQVQAQAEPEEKPKPKTLPRNKPFTPYGIMGYFMDKQGNTRLMLDRRCNAKTVTLDSDWVLTMADIIRKTQEQQHER